MTKPQSPITLAMTGASGLQYGFRLLDCLVKADREVYFVMSQAAYIVAAMEMDLQLPKNPKKLTALLSERCDAAVGQIQVFAEQQWTAPIASGSATSEAMVICPCTSGCLGAVANGLSDNLIERAADVVIKEQKKLILVPREAPYSAIHLENMLKLSRMGVVILPPNPGFYHRPKTMDDLIDFVVARILDQLNIPQTLLKPWGDDEET